MFSAIFALLGLSSSLNASPGRPLTLFTAGAACVLLVATTLFRLSDTDSASADLPALGAAILMSLRALGVGLLPPRGDYNGFREACLSLAFATVTALVWQFVDPRQQAGALTAALLLSWPSLIDGINAFADSVFHKAALASGARDLSHGAFSKIARARDIVIDRAAVMSGPDLMVTNVMAFNNEPRTLLAVAASAEAQSGHPVAVALRQLATQWHVDLKMPDRFEPTPGLGVVALLGGQTVVIGTTDLLRQLKIDSFTADAIARSLEADGKTVLRVAVGGRVVGVLGLEGTLRQDAGVAGMALRCEGLVPWLYTGENPKTREALANMLGLEVFDDPKPGETALEGCRRAFGDQSSLVLTLSPDRTSLELRDSGPADGPEELMKTAPIAVSDTDDIGAFPALKALATRRNLLAVHARRILTGLWAFAGLLGACALLPLAAAPILFALCLAILWTFARFSVADTLKRTRGAA
ncbi:HAD family hydrolase [Labrenzia aggregata]|uniref:HAD family hydrolase n=2 Tax=Roseibium aggregatum TaxID=187304 RepID=A0A939EH49_9HYPH|nr:HAD family hydrolase [Roseibium aggregatum]